MPNKYKNTFIIRETPEGQGYDSFLSFPDGKTIHMLTVGIKEPISGNYEVFQRKLGSDDVIREAAGKSRENAMNKAYDLIREKYKDHIIINETSRAKESPLAQKTDKNYPEPTTF